MTPQEFLALVNGQVPWAPKAFMGNAWPTMIGNAATKALPAAAGLPATSAGSGLPAALTSPVARAVGGAALGPIGAGAMAAGQVMAPTPANQGETPFYIWDPTTKKWVPNPALASQNLPQNNQPPPAGPAGSFGGGANTGYAGPAGSFGGGATPPLPMARPPAPSPAAPIGPPMSLAPPNIGPTSPPPPGLFAGSPWGGQQPGTSALGGAFAGGVPAPQQNFAGSPSPISQLGTLLKNLFGNQGGSLS